MNLISQPLSKAEIENLRREYGNYLKVTVDIERGILVVGGELHADGEGILLKEGSQQDDIWGGGIDLETKTIDTSAVLNIRPRLENDGLEILDPERRKKFIDIVRTIFRNLWS